MPESSELIFEISQDTLLRLIRERFATMTDEERDKVIGEDMDSEEQEFRIEVYTVLRDGKDPGTLIGDYGFYEVVQGLLEPLNKQLGEIHRELIEKRFGETYMGDIGASPASAGMPPHLAGLDPNNWFTYVCAKTPEGRRSFNAFSIERYADEDSYEVNWGIGLTSRYLPAWIDWRSQHGGSGSFKLNKEALEMIEEARDAIAEVLPEIKDADLVNAPNFY